MGKDSRSGTVSATSKPSQVRQGLDSNSGLTTLLYMTVSFRLSVLVTSSDMRSSSPILSSPTSNVV